MGDDKTKSKSVCATLPCVWDGEELQRLLHCGADSFQMQRCQTLYDRCHDAIHPSYAFRDVAVRLVENDQVCVEDAVFISNVLRHQLGWSDHAILYIASSGADGAERITQSAPPRSGADALMDAYLVHQLAYMAYLQAMRTLQEQMASRFGRNRYCMLCPGSVPDWSVRDNGHIFRILQLPHGFAGLQVRESGMISPLESTAGLICATKGGFESCSLCSHSHCENRRAPFDRHAVRM